MVGLTLVVARIFRTCSLGSKSENRSGYILQSATGTCTLHQNAEGLCAILLSDERTHLLGRVLGHRMGYFMSENYRKRSLVLSDRQQSFIDHNLTTGHTESINLLVLYEIELPLVVGNLTGKAVGVEISHNGICKVLPHSLHHVGICHIRGRFGGFHVFRILLITEAEHFFVAHHHVLFSSCDRYRRGGSTTGQYGYGNYQNNQFSFIHFLYS